MGLSPSWPSTDTDPAMEEARLGGAAHLSRRLVPRRRQVLSDNGVKIPLLSDEAFCRSVRSFHRNVMIGASHMRYKFNCAALKCNNAFGSKERKH